MPHISRRQFLQQTGTLAAAGVVTSLSSTFSMPSVQRAATELPDHPNLLIIITDQERIPQYWPENWAADNLPGRKAFDDHGLTFTHHFCNSAMCSPSRGTLFTGLYAPEHGVTRTLTYGGSESPKETPLSPDLSNLATILATAGYHVVLKGKWHLSKNISGGPPSSTDVENFGFHEWTATTVGEANDPADYGGGCANKDAETMTETLDWLNQATLPEPFCLIVGLANPHDVLAYPGDMEAESCANAYKTTWNYASQGISLPPTINENLGTKPTCQAQALDLYSLMGHLLTNDRKNNYVNFYAYLHKYVDKQIKDIYDALNQSRPNGKLLNSTIVVRTADHGEMGLSHGGMRQKMFEAYEESIRVPLVISNPILFPTPKSNDSWVSLVDLLPTLAALAKAPNPKIYPFSGTDLTPIINNPDTVHAYHDVLYTFDDDQAGLKNGLPAWGGRSVVIEQPNHIRSIRHKDSQGVWKFSRYFDPSGVQPDQFEMYHLTNANGSANDPQEINNIANPAVAGYDALKKAEMSALLARLEAQRLDHIRFTFIPAVMH